MKDRIIRHRIIDNDDSVKKAEEKKKANPHENRKDRIIDTVD